MPRFFSPTEQAMLRGFQSFGEYLPGVAVPLVKEKMRRETANVILPAEPALLGEHLRARQSQGVEMNVNLLGEAILGERETKRRMQDCFDALRMPDVKCLSVKISTVYSQVSALARQHTIKKVSGRLESLYRTAMQEVDPQTGDAKFVYLDMEEYRDLYLTADILRETLDRKGLQKARAGVALQAYVPDSYRVMQRLIQWSAQRVSDGGEPLTIRLVKGANMEMERVHASISGHPQPTYQRKADTDANYKRMLRELIDATAKGDLRVGVASHNLFDVALALLWASEKESDTGDFGDRIQIEMLEGMANHQRRAITERGSRMLLYAPACRREGFLNAIGYLIRRLDENTGPENFLRHSYRLKADSPEFESLASGFREAFAHRDKVSDAPRHNESRNDRAAQPPVADHWSQLVNEPDTDWSHPANADWAQAILDRWQSKFDEGPVQIPLMIGSDQVDGKTTVSKNDPSRPEVVVSEANTASLQDVQRAVEIASEDRSGWGSSTVDHRHDVLRKVAQNLRERRGDLIGAMVADGGKTVGQADPEVSEAIDFCEFYPLSAKAWMGEPTIEVKPRGVVAVISPWNFPLAIPCGGIAASLSAGNTVILKPASQTILTAQVLCHAFWDAGVPRDVLQLVPCPGKTAELGLVANEKVDTVILTGGTSTAKRMLAVRPDLHLLAETGGKNATIVTAMADRDQAIKNVIYSAFGHSGQKCSATSLLLLEDEVFNDEKFRETLADAVESIRVGSAWDLSSKMGPLISPPGEELIRGMKTLEGDESWLVVPEHVVGNPNLYRPGVKWNIKSGSFAHKTELFGPILGVMKFSRLEEAIEIVRSTGYGLTSGLESLDVREIELWKQSIGAGNLYINRPTTGAIVLRQPFGGVGLSAYGPGVKAGGPNYVLALMKVNDGRPNSNESTAPHDELDRLQSWVEVFAATDVMPEAVAASLRSVMTSQRSAMAQEFSREHDSVKLVGQDNFRRYRPVKAMTIRVDSADQIVDALTAVTAAVAAGAQVTVSISTDLSPQAKELLESPADYVPGLVDPVEETIDELAKRIRDGGVNRLRLFDQRKDHAELLKACGEMFVTSISEPVVVEGRVECLRYMDEQSVSHDYHRYGNLGRRAEETRRPVG